MGDSAATASADGEASADSAKADSHRLRPVEVADKGDTLLDVTFETSQETLRKSRKAALAAGRKANGHASSAATRALLPVVRVSYRVSLNVLKRNSQYFSNLLTNPQFKESKLIGDAHAALAARNVKPGEADAADLPRIAIVDDDEATQTAAREQIFEDMLRIMHQKPANSTRLVMSYVTTLAVIADRFDCVSVISRALNTDMKFKWPLTSSKPMVDDFGRATDAEKVLRQKLLVAWLLGQPMRLHQASRELIMRGSRAWGVTYLDDEASVNGMSAAWWNLPEGLEEELQFRRECILNAVASVQRHFLRLYGSRERQCKLGYDSSAACDSFQLGQMLKFLVSKGLLFLVDFSAQSLETLSDTSLLDVDELLSTLKQCPNYQVDKHHTNCGLRIRIDPILDYIRSMLSANVISISHTDWTRRRSEASWQQKSPANRSNGIGRNDEGHGEREFAFTRALANDQRLRYEGAIYVDRMARALFTAESWNWTPEV